jgi:hypothetical protein
MLKAEVTIAGIKTTVYIFEINRGIKDKVLAGTAKDNARNFKLITSDTGEEYFKYRGIQIKLRECIKC